MLFGSHIKGIADIEYLRHLRFDMGEVVFAGLPNRRYWREAEVRNDFGRSFFLVAHGPLEGPPNDVQHLWEEYYPALLETVDLAQDMGIEFLTIHLWMDRRFVKAEPLAEKKRLLRQLLAYAGQRSVLVSLENLSESAQDFALVLEAVPDLAITLDVGHAQLLSKTNTSFDIIRDLMPCIKHLHLHDNRGGSGVKDDLHLPIGRGIVDFYGILGALVERGYERTVTLEVEHEHLLPSMEALRRILDAVGG